LAAGGLVGFSAGGGAGAGLGAQAASRPLKPASPARPRRRKARRLVAEIEDRPRCEVRVLDTLGSSVCMLAL
jgi:hypothetical protein